MEGGELGPIFNVCLMATLGFSHCYFLSSRLPPGKLRLVSLLPVIYLFTQLPLLFSTVHLRIISAFFLVWLATFKLLLFSFSQGPLSDPDLSFLLFLALSSLPIKLLDDPIRTRRLSLLKIFSYTLKFALLTVIISTYPRRYDYHWTFLLLVYGVHLYLAIDIVLGFVSFVTLFSIPILAGKKFQFEPHSSPPYLTTSLQDFWGKRWNLMVTRLLHPAVYVPVKSYLGHSAGTISAFMVSGAMHEVLFYYVTCRTPTGEVMCFFALQGVCTAVEIGAKKILGRRKGWKALPTVAAAPLTVLFVLVTAQWLFLPQLLRNKVDERVIYESTVILDAAKTALGVDL